MVTTLTKTGWFGPLTNGNWSDRADRVVDDIGGIVVQQESPSYYPTVANTLAGNDYISGRDIIRSSGHYGFLNNDTIQKFKDGSITILGDGYTGIKNNAFVAIKVGNGFNNKVTAAIKGIGDNIGILNAGTILISDSYGGASNSIAGTGVATAL